MKKILIDVFGSDHPEQLLEGCARCTLEVPDVMLVLPGEEPCSVRSWKNIPAIGMRWNSCPHPRSSQITTTPSTPSCTSATPRSSRACSA